MAGARNIKDIDFKDKFIFFHSLLQLPDNASTKRLLLACLGSSSPKTWTCTMQEQLDEFTDNLPDISALAANIPSPRIRRS